MSFSFFGRCLFILLSLKFHPSVHPLRMYVDSARRSWFILAWALCARVCMFKCMPILQYIRPSLHGYKSSLSKVLSRPCPPAVSCLFIGKSATLEYALLFACLLPLVSSPCLSVQLSWKVPCLCLMCKLHNRGRVIQPQLPYRLLHYQWQSQ